MLGFSSFSELPLSTIPRTPVVNLSEIPVEIISSTVILAENRSMPVEIVGFAVSTPKIPVEILTELVESRTIPVEILSELVETRKIPIEVIATLLVTGHIPVEILSSLYINKTLPIESLLSILGNRKIPVEITTDLVSVIFDLPIEIVGSKPTPEGLKWVLNSRGTTWEVSTKLMGLIWKLSDSGNNTWKI